MSLLWVAKSEWWSRMLVGARSLSHTNSNEVEVAREKEACRERPRGIEEAGGLRQRRSMRATEEAACVRVARARDETSSSSLLIVFVLLR